MKASETKLQKIIEGTNQYVVPLFQRTYSWGKREWKTLWDDLIEIYEEGTQRDHFMGSIVTMPTTSVPEGVAKFTLIDGQQRLTTFFILLAVIRNHARKREVGKLGEEIEHTLLRNVYKSDMDQLKLLPTHVDRAAFIDIVNGVVPDMETPIGQAYRFFDKMLEKQEQDLEKLKQVLVSSLSLVSIVLDRDDNPHLIFESLNAKGRALTQADLLRNYFFMRVHVDQQEGIYTEHWRPMQEDLGEGLTECIRHFLMRGGKMVKQGDVYIALKENADPKNPTEVVEYLRELAKFAKYYTHIIHPETEPERRISERMERLNRIEVTTAYPLILNVYDDYSAGAISLKDFTGVLDTIENFMMRRWVCGVPTYTLNKLFPSLYTQAKAHGNFVEGLRSTLASKNYPKDAEFRDKLTSSALYAMGERLQKTRLLLERIEDSFGHHETVKQGTLTIEHVMPQTLTPWWREHLGENCDETHAMLLHTLGNLTLTGYNGELTNDAFPAKRKILLASHLELNGEFAELQRWTETEIKLRAASLADRALGIWPYFGPDQLPEPPTGDVTGRIPVGLTVLGESFSVRSWRDVTERTVETIAMLDPEAFQLLVQAFPSFIATDPARFRDSRKLSNGYYLLTHFSAKVAYQFCERIVQAAGLEQEDWSVQYGTQS
ncbi:MAG: DUF262 domain-containing protein [Phycisphaerae bacterium]